MFGYEPKLPELIFYPLVAVEVAHGLALALPTEYQAFCVAAVAINCAIVPGIYLWREGCKYIDAHTPDAPKAYPNMTADERPTAADPQLIPRVQSGGQQVYSQQLVKVKIDCIARFNKILIAQRNGNLKVDMSEGFWLKTKEGMDETEWKRIGGDGPTSFRTMLTRGEKFGAYKKDGGQGKWIVAEWNKVRRLANGEPLP